MKFRRTRNGDPDEFPSHRTSRWRRGTRRKDQPDLEPAHDQPWIPTSGLTDKVRRSPRQ